MLRRKPSARASSPLCVRGSKLISVIRGVKYLSPGNGSAQYGLVRTKADEVSLRKQPQRLG